ncbi:MAG: hypothetical protein QXP32_09390 [Nitrososphaeria archaeon]
MKVEICDSWYKYKIVFPLSNKNVKCLNHLRKKNKIVVVFYKKSPVKRAYILYDLIKKFGKFIEEHKWIGYGRMSKFVPAGLRSRSHYVYEVPDKLLELYKKIEKIASHPIVPWDLGEKYENLGELEKVLNELESEVTIRRIAESIKNN